MPLFIKEGEYVTAVEAASLLRLSKQRVSQLTRDGKLPSVGTEGTRLIPLEAVLARKREVVERRHAELARLLAEDGDR
jgi:excisionase family DNA binding protein